MHAPITAFADVTTARELGMRGEPPHPEVRA